MTTWRRLILLTLLASALPFAPVTGADDPASFRFRVETPPVETVPQADGFASIEMDGFLRRDAAIGWPDVPTRTVLVAIPPGATPRLEVRLAGTRTFRRLLPRPAPEIRFEGDPPPAEEMARRGFVERTRRHYEARPEAYEGEGTWPERVAWLGATGTLRDQRFVEVHVAPVRYDRRLRGLHVDPALEITVHFDGDVRTAPVAAFSPDRYEAIYRGAFVNYDQGRTFRLGAVGARPSTDERPARPAVTTGAGGPIRRIRVDADGPVRLDHGLFVAEAPEFLATDPRNWRVTNRGQAVPVQLQQGVGDDAALEAGEWLQFHGQALDDEPATEPNHLDANPLLDLHEVEDVTDENAYFLTVEATAQPPIPEQDGAPPPVGTPVPYFVDTARVEVDNFFWPLEGGLWFWTPFVSEVSGPRSETVALPGLVSGSEPIDVRVGFRGFGDCPGVNPDHRTLVRLRNSLAQTLVLPASNPDNVGNWNEGSYDGNTLFLHDFDWTHSGGDPEVTDPLSVVVDAADIAGSCPTGGTLPNDNLLDRIEIDYRRLFVAVGDRLEFSVPDGDALYEIEGFTSGAIEVYEITGEIGESGVTDAVRLAGVEILPDGPGFKARFRTDDGLSGAPRRFVAASALGATVPDPGDFEADRVSTLISDTTQADLVVIAHPDLVPSACSEGANSCSYDADCTAGPNDRCEVVAGSDLDLLLARRAGEGISARVARVQDVYDEFNLGLAGPDAIRTFLAWLLAGGWAGEPAAYVLLLGDGSYDYKGGTPAGNFVPTQVMVKDGANIPSASILPHYASDSQLAAVAGDDSLADLTVGRISARTLGDAEGILGKILGIEESPGPGSWTHSALFISDRGANNDVIGSEALGFEAMNALAGEHIAPQPPAGCAAPEPYDATYLRYWSDYCGGTMAGCNTPAVTAMRQAIVDRVNGAVGDGAAIVQFAGHGNYDLWSNDVLFCTNELNAACAQDDTALLTNLDRLPWLIAHNCLTGGFHSKELKSFGEQWQRRLFGGAAAIYAPSGLGFQFIGNAIIPVIFDDVFGPYKERRIGVPVLHSQVQLCTQGSIEACQFYVLLGDPTAKLALPEVGRATGVVATPSTGPSPSVTLAWTPSATAGATYDVYRIQVPAQSQYQSVACGVAGGGYVDTSVVHTKTYRYVVVAKHEGFESAWSNFNSDCGPTPGPDCVQAVPLNLVPPLAPTGVTATDNETGGSLLVAWNANAEVDISHYVVHYGTTPALGETATFFGSATQGVVTGLANGTPYWVAVQARNSSGTFSPLSGLVTQTPNMVLGLKSPDFVDDLRLAKSATDALLSWSAVTADIYGKPTTVGLYEVHRSTDPLFVPDGSSLLGTTPVPAFTDPGALAPEGPDYHYLVRAIDTAGRVGGLGRELPRGILDLRLELSTNTPRGVFLSWSPVTTDFDGQPTSIAHYEVWASSSPFTRADIEDEAPGVTRIVPAATGTVVEIVPPAANQYYSVLAVDTRGNRSPF